MKLNAYLCMQRNYGKQEMRIPTVGPVSEFLSFLLSKEETKKTTNI